MKCPNCGTIDDRVYVGAINVECPNEKCFNFKASLISRPKWTAVQKKEILRKRTIEAVFRHIDSSWFDPPKKSVFLLDLSLLVPAKFIELDFEVTNNAPK